MAYPISSGESSEGIILENDSLIVLDGGTASATTVNAGGKLFVSSGGTATGIKENGGYVEIKYGAEATFAPNSFGELTLSGSATLHSGTTANSITVNDGNAILWIFSSGTANSTIMSGGTLYLSSGGMAKNTSIYSRGWGFVSRGGIVNGTVMSGGRLYVLGGGTANEITLDYYRGSNANFINGYIAVASGGIINDTVIKGIDISVYNWSGGIVEIQGGTANHTDVCSGGYLKLSGGKVNDATVGGYPLFFNTNGDRIESGTIDVYDGTAVGVTVNQFGTLNVSGGTVTAIRENGGYVNVAGGTAMFVSNSFSGLVFYNDSGTVHSGTTAVDISVIGGRMDVYSGGKLTGRLICSGGGIQAFEGAIVDFDLTRIIPGGAARINNLSGIQGTPTYTLTVNADRTEGLYILAENASEFNQTITIMNQVGTELGTLAVGETTSISDVDYTLSLSDGTLSLTVGNTITPSPYTSDGLVIRGNGQKTINSGERFHETVILSGNLEVGSGGTAEITSVFSWGKMSVVSGGTADSVFVAGASGGEYGYGGGSLTVSSGGTAFEIVENGGYVELQDGADATFASHIFSSSYLATTATLHSGTTACDVKISDFGKLYIYDGGVVNGLEALNPDRNPRYSITVYSGGTANDVQLVFVDCRMYVSNGGVVNNTIIKSSYNGDGGCLIVSSGGTANSTTFIDRGKLEVKSGGTATGTFFNSGGQIKAENGALLDNTTIGIGVKFVISSGVTATNIVENGGYVEVQDGAVVSFVSNTFNGLIISSDELNTSATIHSGTTANSTTIKDNSRLIVSSGGTADNTIVSNGFLYVSNGGEVNKTTVSSGGNLHVSKGGIASNTTISSGGRFYVTNGGTATGRMSFEEGATVFVYEGAILDFDLTQMHTGEATLVNNLLVIQGVPAYTLTVDDDLRPGRYVYSLADGAGGFDGTLTVQNNLGETFGALAVGETITVSNTNYTLSLSEGSLSVFAVKPYAAVSSGLILKNPARQTVGVDELYEETTLNSGGSLIVSNRGTADTTTVNNYGDLTILSGGIASNVKISSGGWFTVSSGGTATDVVAVSGGVLRFTVAKGTFVSGTSAGSAFEIKNGYCSGYSVNNGALNVSGDGIVDSIMVNGGYYSWLSVSSGGTATNIIENGGGVYVEEGAVVSFAENTFSGLTICGNNAAATVHSGTIAEGTVVNTQEMGEHRASAFLTVFSSGIAKDTTVNLSGNVYISSGGIANGMTICSGGSLFLSSGGTMTGQIVLTEDAYVSAYKGAILDFDISELTPTTEALVNNQSSYFRGTPLYTLTVSKEQENGIYSLVVGISKDFRCESVTLQNATCEQLGILILSKAVQIGDKYYLLYLSDKTLSVVINDEQVFSGLVIAGTTIVVSSGETYTDTTINYDGRLSVSSGGAVINTVVNKKGSLYVSSGGTANSTILNEQGFMYVSSGGVVDDTIINSDGNLKVSSGGVANRTAIEGFMGVSSGGVANSTTVKSGVFGVSSDGLANNTTVNSGRFVVSNGGTADVVIINGGRMNVSSGGMVTGKMTFEDGVVVSMYEGAILNFNLTQAGACADVLVNDLSIIQGTPTYTLTVSDEQEKGVYILADGALGFDSVITVQNTLGESLGTLTVDGSFETENRRYTLSLTDDVLKLTCYTLTIGLIATGRRIEVEEYEIYKDAAFTSCNIILTGGETDSTTLQFRGSMHISSGGIADNTVVNNGAIMYISSGGIASDTTINDYGRVYVFSGGKANNVTNNCGSMHVLLDGIVNNTTLNDYGYLSVETGGTAINTVVNADCGMQVDSNSTATGIIENGGYVNLNNAVDANVSFVPNSFSGALSGWVTVHSGTTANSVFIEYGNLFIFDGGKALYTDVDTEGYITVSSGGIVNSTAVYNGSMFVSSLGIASNTKVMAGGVLDVSSGGIANSIKVYAGGIVTVLSGAMLVGIMDFAPGAIIRVKQGGCIGFDLTQLSADNKSLLNDWSLIQGNPDYIITVKDNQETGIYKLADVADAFDGTIKVKSTSDKTLGTLSIGESIEVGDNTFQLRLDDESLVLNIATTKPIDNIAPTVSNIQVSPATMTNQGVVLTAEFADETDLVQSLYRIGETGDWKNYADGVTVTDNETVFFKAVDAAGNESEVISYTVSNIDRDAPTEPSGLMAVVSDPTVVLIWSPSTDTASGIKEYVVKYSCNGQTFTASVSNTNHVLTGLASGSWTWGVQAVDIAGNESALVSGNSFVVSGAVIIPENLVGSQDKVSWNSTGAEQYIVEYSTDNFAHVIQVVTSAPATDLLDLPAGTYQWRVKADDDNSDWAVGEEIVSEPDPDETPKVVQSVEDGNDDLFFATARGTWENIYYAQNVGSVNDWTGTKEIISADGKGRIQNLFFGSSDPNVLCLTDGENGDAIFVDDVYTELPESVAEHTARLYKIQEVRAGAGDDIVDMTSQRFEYVGDGLTIRGGDGNDTIWATKGNNFLFGDAGNDRIVGASGNDVIAGGIGIDRMQGGGGDDIFTFCDNWGADEVEQLGTGKVTLWFAESESQITASELDGNSVFTNADGTASVTVKGFALADIAVKYGDDGTDEYKALAAAGAFEEFTSQKIFEESGLIASL